MAVTVSKSEKIIIKTIHRPQNSHGYANGVPGDGEVFNNEAIVSTKSFFCPATIVSIFASNCSVDGLKFSLISGSLSKQPTMTCFAIAK